MVQNIVPTWLTLELTYHWVASGEEYDRNGFHVFRQFYGFHPDMTMDRQCVVESPYHIKDVKWKSVGCDQPMAFVCQLPLGKLTYWMNIDKVGV